MQRFPFLGVLQVFHSDDVGVASICLAHARNRVAIIGRLYSLLQITVLQEQFVEQTRSKATPLKVTMRKYPAGECRKAVR